MSPSFPSTNQELACILWRGLRQNKPSTVVMEETQGKKCTLQELEEKVKSLKEKLHAHNLPKFSRVAVLVPRSIHFVVCLLAIWEENLCLCPFVDGNENLVSEVKPSLIIKEENDCLVVTHNKMHPPQSQPTAYIITTSGSSGPHKMVSVPPFYLPNLWSSQASFFEVSQKSRCSWMLSPNFDASISDIGVALSSGAFLLVASSSDWLSPKTFLKDIEKHNISHIDAPPSFLNLLRKKSPPDCLQTVVSGGEVTSRSIVNAWGQKLKWVNVYGPTEATVCTSMCVLAPFKDETIAPLGTPLPLVSYALVNDNNPLPHPPSPNEEGELCIAGPLAHGYMDNEQKTKQCFVEHDNTRWYKTGDLVKYSTNHGYLFLVRLSRVVKHHGKWLMLDDIEDELNKSSDISCALVTVKDNVLQGFLQADDFSKALFWARAKAPQIKVWHPLSKVPTKNGKIARGLL